MKKPEALVPEQDKGNESNTESSVSFLHEAEAARFFDEASQRLLNVNSWHGLAGKASANFQLTDPQGHEVDRPAQEGDYIRINIPGPSNASGQGDDWVHIEAIARESDAVAMRVRPAPSPLDERKDVAHFFDNDASSSFMVKREGDKVIAAVYGRNEKPNTGAGNLVNKIRNVAVAAGAISGGSKIQWKSLTDGIVKR